MLTLRLKHRLDPAVRYHEALAGVAVLEVGAFSSDRRDPAGGHVSQQYSSTFELPPATPAPPPG